MAKVKTSVVNSISPKMSGHQPVGKALPAGDYYGQAKRNPLGKSRDSTFGPTKPLKSRKNAKPTPVS